MKVRDRFVVVGRVPYLEVPAYIAACDACLAAYDPSRHPKLKRHGMFFDPLKVFEYLACQKPTISLDSPNIREILGDREAALLVLPGDRAALSEALLAISSDPERACAMAERGRKLVVEQYSWQAHGDALDGIFNRLVSPG